MTAFTLGDFESQLIGRIYDASLNTLRWDGVLQSIADACNADQCTLFFYDARCRARNFAMGAKASEGIIAKYLQEFIDIEAADFHRQLNLLQEGQVVTSTDLINITGMSYDEIVGKEYMEMFLPQLDFQAGIILLHDNMMCSGMGIRSFTGSPKLGEEQISFLNRIALHLVQAMKIHNRINLVKQTNNAIEEVLKHINTGVFLLDKDLRVMFSNAEAARILESSVAIEIGRQGKLFLTCSQENQQLQTLLQALVHENYIAGSDPDQGIQLAAHAPNQTHPLKLTISSIQTHKDSELSKEGIAVVIFVNDPERPNVLPERYLRDAYSLTPTECTIMKTLLKNISINDIAEQRGTTLETTRSQVKTIMQKTGTHSQAELSRLLMALSSNV